MCKMQILFWRTMIINDKLIHCLNQFAFAIDNMV